MSEQDYCWCGKPLPASNEDGCCSPACRDAREEEIEEKMKDLHIELLETDRLEAHELLEEFLIVCDPGTELRKRIQDALAR